MIDYVLVNCGNPDPNALAAFQSRPSRRLLSGEDGLAAEGDFRYIREDVIDPVNPAWHSPPKLARALMEIAERHRE